MPRHNQWILYWTGGGALLCLGVLALLASAGALVTYFKQSTDVLTSEGVLAVQLLWHWIMVFVIGLILAVGGIVSCVSRKMHAVLAVLSVGLISKGIGHLLLVVGDRQLLGAFGTEGGARQVLWGLVITASEVVPPLLNVVAPVALLCYLEACRSSTRSGRTSPS